MLVSLFGPVSLLCVSCASFWEVRGNPATPGAILRTRSWGKSGRNGVTRAEWLLNDSLVGKEVKGVLSAEIGRQDRSVEFRVFPKFSWHWPYFSPEISIEWSKNEMLILPQLRNDRLKGLRYRFLCVFELAVCNVGKYSLWPLCLLAFAVLGLTHSAGGKQPWPCPHRAYSPAWNNRKALGIRS